MNHQDFWKDSILTLAKIISQQPSLPREIDFRQMEGFLERVTYISQHGLMPDVKVYHQFRGKGTIVGYHPGSAFLIVALGDPEDSEDSEDPEDSEYSEYIEVRRALDPRHLQLLHA